MTSVAQLSKEECSACGEVTLHNERGCVPCQKDPPADEKPAARHHRCARRSDQVGVELTAHGKPKRASRKLTPLQVSIAEHLGRGMRPKDIAAALKILPQKVSNQMQVAREKLNVRTTQDVVQFVRKKSEATA